jgi:hypothetical protein
LRISGNAIDWTAIAKIAGHVLFHRRLVLIVQPLPRVRSPGRHSNSATTRSLPDGRPRKRLSMLSVTPSPNTARIRLSLAEDRRTGGDRRIAVVDRRDAQRKKLLKGGRTFWPNGDSTECIVHNLSETGALLGISGPVPKIFDLVIDFDQSRHSCSIVWRKANRIGVKFLEPHLVRAPNSANGRAGAFRQFAYECRILAGRVESSDRERLIKMARAWEALGRPPRKEPTGAKKP